MSKYFFICIGSAILFCASKGYAQQDTVINGNHYQLVDTKKPIIKSHKREIPLDSQFVMDNKRFQYYNNWFNIGIGAQQNLTYSANLGFAGSVDFNFHAKRTYFQLGGQMTGVRYGFYTNYQVHFGYGLRHEDKDVHVAGFVGVSYSTGYSKVDTLYSHHYNAPGLYIEGEIVKKVAYDLGIGGSLFADWNEVQSMIGARFVFYFSGAYIGKKHVRSQ